MDLQKKESLRLRPWTLLATKMRQRATQQLKKEEFSRVVSTGAEEATVGVMVEVVTEEDTSLRDLIKAATQ